MLMGWFIGNIEDIEARWYTYMTFLA